MICCVCRNYYPPGFTEPIPNTKLHKCRFCKEGKSELMAVSKLDNTIHWDIKEKIVKEYADYIAHLVRNKEARDALIKNTKG